MLVYEISEVTGVPVHTIYDDWPYDSLLGWEAYFEMRPRGWRDDDRAYKLLQPHIKEGTKPWEIFPSLKVLYNPPINDELKAKGMLSMQNLEGSMMFGKMLGARGGTSLDFEALKGGG